jgi:CheY-like chemotaxis protein
MTTAVHPKPLILLASRETGELRDVETALFSVGYRVVTARSEHETLQKVHTHQIDGIVLDGDLAATRHGLTQTLRADPDVSPATPIVLTSVESMTKAERLEALSCGAWDLQHQPTDLEELLVRLGVYLHAKLEVDQLMNECLIDRGSGLYNSHGFVQRAEELGALATRQGLPASCVVFRPSEELPNRIVGDRMGRAFKSVGRLSDALGRTDHSEFAVFAPATAGYAAAKLVQRISDSVTKEVGYVSERGKRITLRAAYSAALPSQKVSPSTLLARARSGLPA